MEQRNAVNTAPAPAVALGDAGAADDADCVAGGEVGEDHGETGRPPIQ